MKQVAKPWGWECWLELNAHYCMKVIGIKGGQRTSLQYHEHKCETNRVESGSGELTLEGESRKLQAGDCVTIHPGQIHRIAAITDLILVEVSTPEVEDVIRIEDDYGR